MTAAARFGWGPACGCGLRRAASSRSTEGLPCSTCGAEGATQPRAAGDRRRPLGRESICLTAGRSRPRLSGNGATDAPASPPNDGAQATAGRGSAWETAPADPRAPRLPGNRFVDPTPTTTRPSPPTRRNSCRRAAARSRAALSAALADVSARCASSIWPAAVGTAAIVVRLRRLAVNRINGPVTRIAALPPARSARPTSMGRS